MKVPKLKLHHSLGERVRVACGPVDLFHYVYAPPTAPAEGIKPYFHPIKTLRGNTVTNFRPHDHLWHHGLAMTCAYLSCGGELHNFWGGGTFVKDKGYVDLPNQGRIVHRSWTGMENAPSVYLDESLDWITVAGKKIIEEKRVISIPEVNEHEDWWRLDLSMTLKNTAYDSLSFGSPSTHGRPMAGYGGLFWRGPRSFLEGKLLGPGGLAGDDIMGKAAPWVAFIGSHDGNAETSTLIFVDQPGNPRYPTKWFVRNNPFAVVSFSFMFDQEFALAPGAELKLNYRLIFADGALSRDKIEEIASARKAQKPLPL